MNREIANIFNENKRAVIAAYSYSIFAQMIHLIIQRKTILCFEMENVNCNWIYIQYVMVVLIRQLVVDACD